MNTANSTPVVAKKPGLIKRGVAKLKQRNANMKREGALKEIKDIERGFGSLENYTQFYPEAGSKVDELRRRGGYSTTTAPNRFPTR